MVCSKEKSGGRKREEGGERGNRGAKEGEGRGERRREGESIDDSEREARRIINTYTLKTSQCD